MRIFALIALLVGSTCWAQASMSNFEQAASRDQALTPSVAQTQTITVPAGTRIPLTLASQITKKSRPGTAVRAVTAFPVTVGTQLAIPVGTYVEGVIDKVATGRSGPSVRMRFNHLLFSNGYRVAVSGANTQAKALSPRSTSPETTATSSESGPVYGLVAQQQSPTLPPPPSHTGAIVGVAVGGAAAAVVAIVLLNRHGGGRNLVLFDSGWQFAMVLENPVSLDSARVAAALAPATTE